MYLLSRRLGLLRLRPPPWLLRLGRLGDLGDREERTSGPGLRQFGSPLVGDNAATFYHRGPWAPTEQDKDARTAADGGEQLWREPRRSLVPQRLRDGLRSGEKAPVPFAHGLRPHLFPALARAQFHLAEHFSRMVGTENRMGVRLVPD